MSIRVNGKVIASNGDVKTETDNLVTTDTNQTITATKVFTAEQQKKSTVIDITTQPENYTSNNAFRFIDKNDQISGYIENGQMASGEITTGIHAKNKDGYQPRVSVFAPLTGMTGAYAIAPITPEDAPIDAITTKGYVDSKTGGLELLDITFAPLGIDESKNKRRYLNGQVIIQSQFPAFTAAVKARMSTMANAFTTETNWQAEKTNSKLGQCGKFVVDDTAGTIRLPCVVNAQGLVDLALIGEIKSESLPNINGSCDFFGGAISDATSATGSFKISATGKTGTNIPASSTSGTTYKLALEASPTYQDNAPVQQEAVQYPYCIIVNTGVDEAERPINNYQVNNVYSYGMSKYYKGTMNNNSWLKSAGQWNSENVYTGMYQWLVEQMNAGVSGFVASTATYTDYDFVINTADQTFRLPLKNGQEGVFADGVKGNGMTIGLTNGTKNVGLSGTLGNNPNAFAGTIESNYGTDVGTTLTAAWSNAGAANSLGLTTDPSKSGIVVDKTVPSGWNLYYYIGDTLQNAQLINVARIEEKLTDVNASSRGYVVDSYHNGTEWYRVYSDGWIEQGGRFYNNANVVNTISFLKPFKNTDYNLLINHGVSGSFGNNIAGWHGDEAWEYTTTSFQAKTYNSNGLNWIVWSACGY